jgi:K+-transporting ATPase ATPase A chain
MTVNGRLQILLFFAVILAVTKPLGFFMAHVFDRELTFLDSLLRPFERLVYRLTAVDETREMRWTEYAVTMLLSNLVTLLALYLVQRLQSVPLLNPQALAVLFSAGTLTAYSAQRACREWTRGRGGGRREHAAAR